MVGSQSVWEKVPPEVRRSLESSWGNDVPAEASAIHARWWQLESWLRQLVHLELRANDGVRWSEQIAESARKRTEKSQRIAYMASPDAQTALAHLDVYDLCKTIEDNWELFQYSLIEKQVWDGRWVELREIRNRIAHCRRPHHDDLGRVEQFLRDLERGAFRAVATYNRRFSPPDDVDDPIVDAWVRCRHEAAARLVRHAERQYDTSLLLQYSRRPWAIPGVENGSVSGQRGYLWHALFIMRGRHLSNPADLWTDSWLDIGRARDLFVHLEIDKPYMVEAVLPAIDDPGRVADAIGHCFDALLTGSRPGIPTTGELDVDSADRERDQWASLAAHLDPRVQVHTVWTTLDETTVPVSIFGTGGVTRQGDI